MSLQTVFLFENSLFLKILPSKILSHMIASPSKKELFYSMTCKTKTVNLVLKHIFQSVLSVLRLLSSCFKQVATFITLLPVIYFHTFTLFFSFLFTC